MKKYIFKIINNLGIPYIVRELFQKNKITILLFHDINHKEAESVFKFLLKRYNIIDLNYFLDVVNKKNKNSLPTKALIMTFDDGHINNYKLLPIIKKYSIPITIFLCSSIVSTNRKFWFKIKDISKNKNNLKKMSNHNRLRSLSNLGFNQKKEYEFPEALTETQINEMKKYVNFQSHTLFHPCLPMCSYNEAKEEIFNSKKDLEKKFKMKINSISYPNGNYSKRDILLSKEAGYNCGITVDSGYNSINTDLFRLKRFSVNDTSDLNELSVKASGFLNFFKKINGFIKLGS